MKTIGTILCAILLLQTASHCWAITEEQWKQVEIVKLKNELLKLSLKSEPVEVKLKSKTKLKGHVREIKEDQFTLFSGKGTTIIFLRDVSNVRRYRPVTNKTITIGVVAGVVTSLVFLGWLFRDF